MNYSTGFLIFNIMQKYIFTLFRSFLLLAFCGAASLSFAQGIEKTEVPKNTREADPDYQEQREEWINLMHRAEPGVNWQAVDAETRNAKFEVLQSSHPKHSVLPLGVSYDTLAGGRLIGSWNERGSNNISGRMITADIDFDRNIIFAASAMGNIWKTDLAHTDGWVSVNDNHRFGGITMLRIITTSKGKRLIAVANGPAQVYYSDDDGITWQTATGLDGPKSWGGFKRGVMTADESTIYLFGNEWDYTNWYAVSTLYKSTDQGKSFTNLGRWRLSSDLGDVWVSRDTISSVFFLKGDTLFDFKANGSMGLVHIMTYSDSVSKIGSVVLQGAVVNEKTNLAVLETTNGVGTITMTFNGGATWRKTGKFMGGIFGYNSFKMLPTDPNTLAIGTIETFISRTGGDSASWRHTNGWGEYYGDMKSKLHADIDGIDFLRDRAGNGIELISTDGGIFMSTDTLHTFVNLTLTGIRTSQYYSVLTARQAPYFIYGGTQDQGYQRTLDSSSGRLSMYQTISGDYGHLTSSNNGRSTWCDYPGFALYYPNAESSNANRGWNFKGNNHLWMPPIISDPLDSASAFIACGGTKNESYIWHLVNTKDSVAYSHWNFDFSGGNSGRNVSAIAFSPIDHSRCYVLTNDGQFFDSLGVDGKWKQSDSVKGPGSHYFYGSVIIPSTKNIHKLWIAGSGYSNPAVFVSNDEGQTFTPIDSGLPHTLIYSMAASEDEQFLFAATDVGPYVYSVESRMWYDMSHGEAPDMVYWSVEYIPSLKIARFGSHGRGIWDFAIKQARNSVQVDSSCPPIPHFNLTALPPLFSTTTTISVQLPTSEAIAIRIYDFEGRLVRTIVNTNLPSGFSHFIWNGSSDNGSLLPSGFYTCIAIGMGKADFVKIDLVR